jgi:hypothetical protein
VKSSDAVKNSYKTDQGCVNHGNWIILGATIAACSCVKNVRFVLASPDEAIADTLITHFDLIKKANI